MLAIRISLAIALIFVPSCLQNRLTNDQRYTATRPVLTVDCDNEHKLSPFALRRMVTDYDYKLTPSCSWQDTKELELNSTRPVRIMFVIDITGSMGKSLKEIKNNLIDFSYKLQQFGWDARFGAIGFKDNPDEQQFVDFDFASTLYPMMSGWQAAGGGDLQEAGQTALTKAVDAVIASKKAEARSPSGIIPDYYIVYVSDAPIYVEDDHHDFSIDGLADKLDGTGIHMIYAIDPSTDPAAQGVSTAKPTDQMVELVQRSKIMATPLDYPIAMEKLLNNFTKEFTSVSRRVPMTCILTRAELGGDPSEKGVITSATLDNLDQGNFSDHLTFTIVHDSNVKKYILTTHRRCCPEVQGAIDCNDKVMPVPLSFEDSSGKM